MVAFPPKRNPPEVEVANESECNPTPPKVNPPDAVTEDEREWSPTPPKTKKRMKMTTMMKMNRIIFIKMKMEIQ